MKKIKICFALLLGVPSISIAGFIDVTQFKRCTTDNRLDIPEQFLGTYVLENSPDFKLIKISKTGAAALQFGWFLFETASPPSSQNCIKESYSKNNQTLTISLHNFPNSSTGYHRDIGFSFRIENNDLQMKHHYAKYNYIVPLVVSPLPLAFALHPWKHYAVDFIKLN